MLETGLGYISLVGRISASLRNLEKSCQSCKLCGKLPPPLLPPPTKKDDVPSNSDSNTLPNHLKNVKLMQGSRIRTTLPIIDRSKVAPKLPAEQFISLPSNKDFDEYLEGPTIEDHTTNSDAWDSLPTNPYAIPFIRGCWENFKDYGYRLEPSFALMFNNEDPKLVEEHLLPTQSLSPNSPHLNDKRPQMEMSIEDMNSYSSDPWSSDAVKAFVCGKLGPTEEEFVIDPTFDKVPLSIDNITINFDIDSMIWVTHHLKFNQAISVHVLPSYSNLPPIYRNNHVYVNILMPRSDLDKSTHFSDRQEWFSKPFPVSVIPHMHFATLGRGAGSINISVMFPRMIHRNEYSGFRVNKVPFEVQCFWLTGIVLPAIVAVAIAGEEEYVNYNLDEWRWKACHHDAFTNVKTSAIIPSKLDRLQFVMRDIISKNYIDFGMFGSFFFVSDARGIKSLTLGDDPYAALKREYSSMDWEYAMERKNGQLFLDLGISYHPKTHSGEPLVGLWRLDALAESYDAAGMTKGVIHHTTTLSEYGNRQSSMDQYRSHVVQIPFRQSYNLAFEAIRSPGKKNYFCDDKEAYNNTAEFQQCLSKYRTLLTSSEMKSFGVREEIRGSGRAIIEALKHCKNKVKNIDL
jgi:hypothetical protein